MTRSSYEVYLIHRDISGISLNPREYVMDPDNPKAEMQFSDRA